MQVHFNQPFLMSYRNTISWIEDQNKVFEKLSSGRHINRASDDPAGLSVSEKLRTQVNGYKQALQNSLDGISLLQTSEGIASAIHDMLQRIRALTVQSSNDVYGSDSRNAIQEEIDQIKDAIKGVTDINFNTKPLLKNDDHPNEYTQIPIHTGANKDEILTITLINAKKIALDYVDPIDVTTQELSENALPELDTAINKLSKGRAILGAQQNKLEKHINMIRVAHSTNAYSETMIRDTDMAHQMMNLTRNQILTKSGATMYAQANLNFKNVLEVLPA